jgi:hypothetical protein
LFLNENERRWIRVPVELLKVIMGLCGHCVWRCQEMLNRRKRYLKGIDPLL